MTAVIERFLILLAVLALVAAAALVRHRVRAASPAAVDQARIDAHDVPGGLDAPLTALIVKSRFCLACDEAREILRVTIPEVPVRVVDVSEAPHLVRALNLQETPTTVLLDQEGRVRDQSVGVPDPEAIWLDMRRVWVQLETEGRIARRGSIARKKEGTPDAG